MLYHNGFEIICFISWDDKIDAVYVVFYQVSVMRFPGYLEKSLYIIMLNSVFSGIYTTILGPKIGVSFDRYDN
jgi:hypothetical protein